MTIRGERTYTTPAHWDHLNIKEEKADDTVEHNWYDAMSMEKHDTFLDDLQAQGWVIVKTIEHREHKTVILERDLFSHYVFFFLTPSCCTIKRHDDNSRRSDNVSVPANLNPVPSPPPPIGLRALRGIWQRRSVMGALEAFHQDMGDVFHLPLFTFNPVMLVGPEASRFLLITARDDVRWRLEGEPITRLLRHGVLVEDNDSHDRIRRAMNPALHRQMLQEHVTAMSHCIDAVIATWQPNTTYDMLVEMRKAALLILADTLFGVDFTPELQRLWRGVMRAVKYISPGFWVVYKPLARFGYNRELHKIDTYLYRIIAERRQTPGTGHDLLSVLIDSGMDDELIRDQLMTMIIAGHDTSTASLAWTLYLLGKHPDALRQAQAEVHDVIGHHDTPTFESINRMPYLKHVFNESLRLYPPIHLGSRIAAVDLEFDGFYIPAETRVLYSIYLTQRHPDYWDNPNDFMPERFEAKHPPYTFLPFGGGPRNCIGAAFAQIEGKVVLARLLQKLDFTLMNKRVRPYMGATLEPRPGVMMQVRHL
jgi:cytochrome P450